MGSITAVGGSAMLLSPTSTGPNLNGLGSLGSGELPESEQQVRGGGQVCTGGGPGDVG